MLLFYCDDMKKFIIGFIFIVSIILVFGFLITPYQIKVKETTISISDIEDSYNGLKIVQISDILISKSTDIEMLETVVEKINNIEPDIVIFTGDLINKEYTPTDTDIKVITKYLNSIECTLYKYASIGDNDLSNLSTYKLIMNDSNFIILDNSSTYLFYKSNKPIKITGITNLDNISNSLTIDDNYDTSLNIVLSHYPDYIDNLASEDIDIMFSGHSLLGQVRIPFFGGIIKRNGASKYIDNYYEVNNIKLYVSGGIGTENIKFRLFNKPEINLYRIERGCSEIK